MFQIHYEFDHQSNDKVPGNNRENQYSQTMPTGRVDAYQRFKIFLGDVLVAISERFRPGYAQDRKPDNIQEEYPALDS
jgi:hypothetical protein